MILGMDEWTNSDTETEKENEPAKKWLSWVAKDLNQVAAPMAVLWYAALCIVYWAH